MTNHCLLHQKAMNVYDANAAISRKTKTNLASAYKTIFAPNTDARNTGAPKLVDQPKSEYPTQQRFLQYSGHDCNFTTILLHTYTRSHMQK